MMKRFDEFLNENSVSVPKDAEFFTFEEYIDNPYNATDPDIIDDIKKKAKEIGSKVKKIFTSDDDGKKVDSSKDDDKSSKGGLNDYLKALAFEESSNDPKKVNSLNYMGLYQFGEDALNDILKAKIGESFESYKSRVTKYWPEGFGDLQTFYNRTKDYSKNTKALKPATKKTVSDFKYFVSKFKSKKLEFWPVEKQNAAIIQLLKNNYDYLNTKLGGIKKYADTIKHGVKITIPGLLAGAHLLGPEQVKSFLKSGSNKSDAYGTSIKSYIEKFANFYFMLP